MRFSCSNNLIVLLFRLAVVYTVFMICRLTFYICNDDLLDPLSSSNVWQLLRGSFMFDTVSVLYTNLLFIVLSLLPFRFRNNKYYRKVKLIVYMITNSIGLLINTADIFYYPFKKSRIVLGDFTLLEANFDSLFADLFVGYWYGFVLYFALLVVLYTGYHRFDVIQDKEQNNMRYYLLNTSYLTGMTVAVIFLIRGATFSAASFPISIGDAFMYTTKICGASTVKALRNIYLLNI